MAHARQSCDELKSVSALSLSRTQVFQQLTPEAACAYDKHTQLVVQKSFSVRSWLKAWTGQWARTKKKRVHERETLYFLACEQQEELELERLAP